VISQPATTPAWRWLDPVGLPVYPVLFAAAVVLSRYLESVVPLPVVVRPLLVAVGIAAAMMGVTALVTRNRHVGALIAAIAFLALIGNPVAALVFAAAEVPLVAGLARTRRIPAMDWRRLTTFLNVVATVALAINVAGLANAGPWIGAATPVLPSTVTEAGRDAPDVYLLMLDGYPRADTLASEFGFDNSPFLTRMEDLGFEVAAKSHSNYNATLLTRASLLNMEHIAELIPEPPSHPADQERLLQMLISGGAALRELRGLGYTIVGVPAGASSVAMYGADQFLDSGQPNSFEVALLETGVVPHILPDAQAAWFYQQARDRIHATFDRLEALAAERPARPRFIYAHVMAPHPPIVFRADGSPQNGFGCFPEHCGLWDEVRGSHDQGLVVSEIQYLNSVVLGSVAHVIQTNQRPAVIVVFSDHGYRADLDDRDEMLHNLFLSYTPGHPGVFPQDVGLVNVVPRIVNAYLPKSLPLATRESYVVELRNIPTSGYFPLVPWAP
jgi:hypothetical protein